MMDSLMTDSFLTVLKSKGIEIHTLYIAIQGSDFSNPVLVAKDILDKSGFFINIQRDRSTKSELTSNKLREAGNVAYCSGQYQLALEFYNKALAYAPENSQAMKLVYSNRSALLLKNLCISASLNDIEKCFALGCPSNIKEKLMRRKAEVFDTMWIEKLALEALNSTYLRDFFKINTKMNADVPCASATIAIIEGCNKQEIVTTKNVKVGTVLAQETAFMTELNEANKYFACYYCTKLSMNLMPCPGCCHVLFCSEDCKKLSMAEGHSIECTFLDIIIDMDMTNVHFAFKSALKIKNKCKSWDEFINASHSLGEDRIKRSTIKEIYDVNEKFSMLNAKNDSIFVHGKLYLCSFACAVIMHFLSDVPSFLPSGQKEKHNAICALMRITIHLFLYAPPMIVTPCASAIKSVTKLHVSNSGSFPLMGKLKHSCHPNCLAVCLNDKVALVAIEPIKSGTELTITQFGQFKSHEQVTAMNTQKFNRQLFRFYGTTCNCTCSVDKLSMDQKKMLTKLDFAALSENSPENISEIYPKLCKTLAALSNVTHTEEYELIFDLFSGCILRAQEVLTRNVIIDFDHF